IDVEDPRAELELRAVPGDPPVSLVAVLAREFVALVLHPVAPHARLGERSLVVEDERSAWLEVLEQPAKGFEVMFALAAESERSANDDRPEPARELELVHRLRIEVRRVEALAYGALACEGEHVGRDVAAV